jgi:hypothetical protein
VVPRIVMHTRSGSFGSSSGESFPGVLMIESKLNDPTQLRWHSRHVGGHRRIYCALLTPSSAGR